MKTLIPVLESRISADQRLARLERGVISLLKPEFPIGMQHHIKALWHRERIGHVLRGEPEKVTPITVELVPSLECNLSCGDCTYRLWKERTISDAGKRIMPYEVMTDLLDKIGDAGVNGVIFTGGGEPMTNPRTIDGLKYAGKKRFETGFFTNGTLFDEAKAADLAESNISFVRVSFNSADQENYLRFHRIKNPAVYHKAKENIRLMATALSGTETSFGLGMIVNGINVEFMRSVALFAKELLDKDPKALVSYIGYRPVLNYGQSGCDLRKQITQDVARRAIENFQEVKAILSGYPIVPIIADDYFVDAAAGQPIGGKDCKSCLGHPWAASIAYDGRVYLCSERDGNPDFLLGDLRSQPLERVWESVERKAAIGRIGVCPPTCKIHRTNTLLGVLSSEGRLAEREIEEFQAFLDVIRNAGDPGGTSFI